MKHDHYTWRRIDAPASRADADEPVTWVFFAGGGDVGTELHRLADAADRHVLTVRPGPSSARISDVQWQVDPADPDGFGPVLEHAAGLSGSVRFVFLWGLECAGPAETDAASLQASLASACEGFVHLTDALAQRPPQNVSLFVVVRGTQSVGRSLGPVSVAQAPLWSLGARATTLLPQSRVVLVDLDLAAPRWEAQTVYRDLTSRGGAGRIAYRDSERYEAAPDSGEPADDPTDGLPPCLQLAVRERGSLEGLVVEPGDRVDPEANEVEIRVEATGLNFRDVLNVMDLFPGDAGPFGIECAGTVARTGSDVKGFAPGDAVMAAISRTGGFRTYATVPARYVLHRPARFSPAAAATIPVVYITAIHALHDLARIERGDRILIHAATGGVGLAAVQLAKEAGAEIFGTAGNPRKRAYLSCLGIPHVMDSRSLAYADEIMEITSGAGVDIVLNGLTGEHIRKSLSVLAPGGRFIEMGKREVLSPDALSAIRDDVAYVAFDLMERAHDEPAFVAGLFQRLDALQTEGKIRPLPMEVFPMREVTGAFRFMSKARHVGKVVVIQDRSADVPSPAVSSRLRADGTYLVVGRAGPESLGLCHWLAARGIGRMVMAVPDDPPPAAGGPGEQLQHEVPRVLLERVFCSVPSDLAAFLDRIADPQFPLRGVMYLASRERRDNVGAEGITGAWNLHAATQSIDLDLFVLASHDADAVGDLAVDGFQEALTRHRRALGLPSERLRLESDGAALPASLDRLFPAETPRGN